MVENVKVLSISPTLMQKYCHRTFYAVDTSKKQHFAQQIVEYYFILN